MKKLEAHTGARRKFLFYFIRKHKQCERKLETNSFKHQLLIFGKNFGIGRFLFFLRKCLIIISFIQGDL